MVFGQSAGPLDKVKIFFSLQIPKQILEELDIWIEENETIKWKIITQRK